MALETLQVGLRIAVVQLNSQVGHNSAAINTAKKLVQHMKADWLAGKVQKPDLVVFPEFALTGYNFKDRKHIIPYCSIVGQGPSYEIARNVSKTFGCITVMGYPERESNSENTRLFNSAIVIGESGEILFNYRKSFLYHTDEDWGCNENPKGFEQFPLVFRGKGRDSEGRNHDVSLKTSIGICMDLSPYRFEAPFNDFEFATFCIDKKTELIICPMAWLHASSVTRMAENPLEQRAAIQSTLERQQIPITGVQGELKYDYDQLHTTPRMGVEDSALVTEYRDLDAPDMNCVNYWLLRFLPFLALKQRSQWLYKTTILPMLLRLKPHMNSYLGATRESSWAFKDHNAVLVVANRCGIEDQDTIFSGSSGIYKFNGGNVDSSNTSDSLNKSVELLGNLGKGKEGVLIREVNFEVLRDLGSDKQGRTILSE